MQNDLPLSDPILEFPSPREPSGVGDGRAANGSPVEGKRVSTVPRERSRSPQSSRGKPLKQVQCSQSADNEKQESTLAAREVGPAANTEKSVAFAEREVGPAGDKKVTGSSAREAASSAVAIGLAKQVAGPIALPGDVCPGSNGAIPQSCLLQTKPSKYGIISLFDGVSSVVRVLTKKLGCPPTAILLRRMMSRYDDWFVPSLDIELMRSGAIRRQHQLAYTFPMSTSLLTMIVFCFVNLQLSSPVSNGLLLGVPMPGPHLCWIFTWPIRV